jgi:hypothetical protein
MGRHLIISPAPNKCIHLKPFLNQAEKVQVFKFVGVLDVLDKYVLAIIAPN